MVKYRKETEKGDVMKQDRRSRKWFYNSQAWKNIRKEALNRDMYTCQMCGARATEVHHIKELDDTNVHDASIALNLDNLQSLCHDCHSKITLRKNRMDCGEGYYFDTDGNLQKIEKEE